MAHHDHDDLTPRAAAVEEVLSLRAAVLSDRAAETVSIEDGVTGRTLADEIVAESDVPDVSIVTMDGFAFDATEGPPFELRSGEVFPEDEPPSLGEGEAIRVATGTPIPPSANAVLKKEEAVVDDGTLDGPSLDPGTYVYERGSNVAAGETLFEAGERLSPKDAILLRDLGRETVTVHEPFGVGLLATGTEIHEGRTADLDSPMLADLVRSWGHEPAYEGAVPDDYDRVEDAIERAARDHDVVLTTGGTSVGKKDHVLRVLRELGEVLFHRVRLRPGKPIAAARLTDFDAVVFAIPGKPLGAHAVTTLVVGPFFTGETTLSCVSATFGADVDVPASGFEYAIPVTLSDRLAEPLGHTDSPLPVYDDTFDPSVLSSSTRATRADGFILTESGLSAGERVDVIPYPVVE